MNSAAQRSDLTVIYIIYTGTTQLDAATVNIYMQSLRGQHAPLFSGHTLVGAGSFNSGFRFFG